MVPQLPQYAYAFSRTFITHEEKQLYFPNLFSRVAVDLDTEDEDSDSSCASSTCSGGTTMNNIVISGSRLLLICMKMK